MFKHLMRLTAVLATIVAVGAASASGATRKPVCHWTHHKAGAVNVYVQVCKVTQARKHKTDSRWTTAGPGNSPAPRIG